MTTSLREFKLSFFFSFSFFSFFFSVDRGIMMRMMMIEFIYYLRCGVWGGDGMIALSKCKVGQPES